MALDGDRILVLKRKWLDLIIEGRKVIEVRGMRLRAGAYLIGCKGKAFARIRFGQAYEIKTDAHWKRLAKRHLVATPCRPYKHTWAIPVENVEALSQPIPYHHPRGAVGIVVYRSSGLEALSGAPPNQ